MTGSEDIAQSVARLAARWIGAAWPKPLDRMPAGAPRQALAGAVAAIVLRPRAG